jgi:hypothetical protein
MRHLILPFVFVVAACGGNSLVVRSLDEGSLGDRYLYLVESQFALIAKSSSAEDAVQRIGVYCAEQAPAIEKLRQDGAGMTEAEGEELGKSLAPRFEKLMQRAKDALEDKASILGDMTVLAAMAQCAPQDLMAPLAPE